MQVNKIEINADHDARLDACLEEIVDVLREGTVDADTLGLIMAVRHNLSNSEIAELIRRALALKQQQ